MEANFSIESESLQWFYLSETETEAVFCLTCFYFLSNNLYTIELIMKLPLNNIKLTQI